jgi:hypothetical protein
MHLRAGLPHQRLQHAAAVFQRKQNVIKGANGGW